jgi:riboflavin synthase
MFTGLIQDVGRVALLRPGPTTRLEIETALPVAQIALGESVAIDGCCLTVVEARAAARVLAFDATEETLRRTTLGGYRTGSAVNLERALALGDRLGGHLVQGHVDATVDIVRSWPEGGSLWLEIGLPKELAPFFIEKGSVTVDGISLTVNTLGADRFGVTLIPETQARTTLAKKPVGARVNLEADLIGKYVARQLSLGLRPGVPSSANTGAAEKLDELFIKRAGWSS